MSESTLPPFTDPNAEAARLRAAQADQAARPEGLPEKFKTVAAMSEAYTALETKLGGTPAPDPAVVVPPGAAPGTPAVPDATPVTGGDGLTISADQQTAGFDFTPFEAEFEKTGVLTDESYTKLQSSGMSRTMVDRYIAGQLAVGAAQTNSVFASVGGQEKYKEILDWAGKTMTTEEATTFNSQVQGQSPEVAIMAIKGLQARHVAAVGTQPNLISGAPPGGVVAGYESTGEMQAAINDPRYDTDAAYRAKVGKRIEGMV